jgi:NADPH2:quinone reductase
VKFERRLGKIAPDRWRKTEETGQISAVAGDLPKMRAILLHETGAADRLQAGEAPVPQLRPGHVLVRVHATSLNPVDVKIRRGMPITPELPAILHGDVAGTVESIAADVRSLRPGDHVYGCAGGVRGSGGALAEFMLADARLLALKPERLSFAEAAALPLVGITAWEALFDRAGLPEPAATRWPDHGPNPNTGTPADAGDAPIDVLVQAAAGGVGHVALQLARAAGARVFATASTPAKQEIARRFGAQAIAYREETVADCVRRLTAGAGFPIVFDTVGGECLDRSFEAVSRGGQVLAIATRSSHDLSPLHAKGATLHVVFMLQPLLFGTGRERHGEILRALACLVDDGRLEPLLDSRRFGFSEAAEAHRYFESGQVVGKVVLENDL